MRANASRSLKNVHVLLSTSDLCRALCGLHAICCKSGKDRTAMGVTLENCRFLAFNLRVSGACHLCQVMRRWGARRRNVYANTGQSCYAFHDLQQPLVPACYRAPNGTVNRTVGT
jgi:inositol polyphosphate-4-phosphatase